MSKSNRRKGGFTGASTASQALRATTPGLGQSPRDAQGRSTLPKQGAAPTEYSVRAQLLEKVGQEGIDALFVVAKKSTVKLKDSDDLAVSA